MNVGGVGRKFECPIGLTVDAHRTCLAATWLFPASLHSAFIMLVVYPENGI